MKTRVREFLESGAIFGQERAAFCAATAARSLAAGHRPSTVVFWQNEAAKWHEYSAVRLRKLLEQPQ